MPKANPGAPHQPVGSLLVLPPQVIDADEEAILVVTDHVPDFTVVNPLIFLQKRVVGGKHPQKKQLTLHDRLSETFPHPWS